MSITRVRELAREMAAASTPVVCSFTQQQVLDLLAEIDLRTAPAAAPPPAVVASPVDEYVNHRKGCERCGRPGAGRCELGQRLYPVACAALMDQARLLL